MVCTQIPVVNFSPFRSSDFVTFLKGLLLGLGQTQLAAHYVYFTTGVLFFFSFFKNLYC